MDPSTRGESSIVISTLSGREGPGASGGDTGVQGKVRPCNHRPFTGGKDKAARSATACTRTTSTATADKRFMKGDDIESNLRESTALPRRPDITGPGRPPLRLPERASKELFNARASASRGSVKSSV